MYQLTVMESWPFTDPPNLAVVTVKQVVQDDRPVLLVVHDSEDSGWQFLTGEVFDLKDGKLVSLQSMIEHDPSLAALADLSPGWQAQRVRRGYAWTRCPTDSVDQ